MAAVGGITLTGLLAIGFASPDLDVDVPGGQSARLDQDPERHPHVRPLRRHGDLGRIAAPSAIDPVCQGVRQNMNDPEFLWAAVPALGRMARNAPPDRKKKAEDLLVLLGRHVSSLKDPPKWDEARPMELRKPAEENMDEPAGIVEEPGLVDRIVEPGRPLELPGRPGLRHGDQRPDLGGLLSVRQRLHRNRQVDRNPLFRRRMRAEWPRRFR